MTGSIRAGRAGARLLAAAGVLAVAACGVPEEGESWPPAGAVVEEVPPPPQPPPPRPLHKPTPPPAADEAPAPAAGEAPASEPAVAGFDQLQGLDREGILALFGEPQQRGDAPPAQLWHYASRDCELDVYFYLDLQTQEMRVLHYEVKGHDGAEQPQQRCYDEFVAERRAPSESDRAQDPPR